MRILYPAQAYKRWVLVDVLHVADDGIAYEEYDTVFKQPVAVHVHVDVALVQVYLAAGLVVGLLLLALIPVLVEYLLQRLVRLRVLAVFDGFSTFSKYPAFAILRR